MFQDDRVGRLRITLDGIEPEIWRRVELPLTATLRGLHDVIQSAFAWEGYHRHLFEIGEDRYGVPDPEWDDVRPIRSEKGTRLATLVERGVTAFGYTYDFGDDWRHSIAVELVEAAVPDVAYPRFLAGARRAPPEDVGGIGGYGEFIRAVDRQDRKGGRGLERPRAFGGPAPRRARVARPSALPGFRRTFTRGRRRRPPPGRFGSDRSRRTRPCGAVAACSAAR